MAAATATKNEDTQIAKLRLATARRGWTNRELAAALNVSTETLTNNFCNEFSSRAMRKKVNAVFAPQVIFTEGVGTIE